MWLPLLAPLLACSPGADYGLSAPSEANPAGWDTILVSADVALQRNNFGADLSRCQVQVAFEPVLLQDAAPDQEEPAAEPWSVTIPDEPGTCAFTQETLPDEGEQPGEPDDNWYVSGSLAGPPWVELQGIDRDLVLEPVQSEDGRVRYELPAEQCSDQDFPVGQVFDLVVPPGDDADAMPAFTVPQALAVGPDVFLTSPTLDEVDGDRVPHSVDQALPVAWELVGELPVVDGQPLSPDLLVKVYNQDEEGSLPSEWLVCLPADDGSFTVPTDSLGQLTANPGPDDDRWFASVTVHTETTTPAFDTPWGEPVQLRAHVSEGGFVLLID